ncbi:hypothetical protein D3C85_1222990 [compost metagenome]
MLLATRKGQAADFEFVLDLVPQRRALQGVLHAVAQIALVAIEAQAKGDVIENAH